jgi:hypothetical protein
MLPRPPSTICPKLTRAQARRLAHLKRSGHYITGYEGVIGDNFTAVVFITSRTEFTVHEDGTDLSADELALLPARPSSGRRRSLRDRTPMVPISEESNDAQQ